MRQNCVYSDEHRKKNTNKLKLQKVAVYDTAEVEEGFAIKVYLPLKEK